MTSHTLSSSNVLTGNLCSFRWTELQVPKGAYLPAMLACELIIIFCPSLLCWTTSLPCIWLPHVLPHSKTSNVTLVSWSVAEEPRLQAAKLPVHLSCPSLSIPFSFIPGFSSPHSARSSGAGPVRTPHEQAPAPLLSEKLLGFPYLCESGIKDVHTSTPVPR